VFSRVNMRLWLETDTLTSVEETSIYATAVGIPAVLVFEGPPEPFRIDPQDIVDSAIYQRMASREDDYGMPPAGTEDEDQDALTLMETWINSLPPPPP